LVEFRVDDKWHVLVVPILVYQIPKLSVSPLVVNLGSIARIAKGRGRVEITLKDANEKPRISVEGDWKLIAVRRIGDHVLEADIQLLDGMRNKWCAGRLVATDEPGRTAAVVPIFATLSDPEPAARRE
jgi:hypothetical protein